MKTPRFEELARRWKDKANVYIVFSEEAHPHAASSQRLNGFAEHLKSLDADKDNAVALAEYGSDGPRFMFDAFDLDHDGVIRSHEFLAARRIDQFADVDEPRTPEDRLALARRFRAEVPGDIPVLLDSIDNATAKAYGGLPNSAYVIGPDARVAFKIAWASVSDIDRELARLTGAPVPAAPPPPDLSPISGALAAHRPVLVEFTAPGCAACTAMQSTLTDPTVVDALRGYQVLQLSVDHDDAWRLFESLDLSSTPAFVRLAPDGTIGPRLQGLQPKDGFLAFLRP